MRIRLLALAVASWAGIAFAAEPASKLIPAPPTAVTKAQPESVAELKTFQKHVHDVIDKVIPCTVCLQVGGASGSGVIVSNDGIILTAGHVSGEPGKKVAIFIHGRSKPVDGITLGFNPGIDSGMVKITEKGDYPYTEVAPSRDLKEGTWVVSTGHPGGIKKDRPPVVRVGKIGKPSYNPPGEGGTFIQTDCTLVGGDSGGPLFDMEGRVIGIHSRIGNTPGVGASIAQNMHVPSDRYTEEWDALMKGEVLGVDPYLGVIMQEGAKDCKLGRVTPNSPASRAGLKEGDIVKKWGGKEISNYDEMLKTLAATKPHAEVTLEVKRGDETKEIKVKIGYRQK